MNEDIQNYKLFLSGDNLGFENLVIKYRHHLVYFVERYVNNIEIAQDIAQDAFVEIFVNKNNFNIELSFKTFLFTIARNKAVDYIRKNKNIILVGHNSFNILDGDQQKELETHVFLEEDKKAVRQSIGKLKREYQIIIDLVEFEDMSYAEAAAIMNKNVGQVKVLLHRAKKALRKKMEGEGFNIEK